MQACRTIFRGLFGLVLLSGAVPAQEESRAGVADYTFAPLFGHDGRVRLSELHGSPVLVSGFRKRIPDGLHAAWLAHAIQNEYARKGCVVVLRDVERWKPELHGAMTRSFWLRFFDSSPWITSVGDDPLPFREGGEPWTDRSLVLIGVDGKVVLEGTIDDYADRARRGSFQARIQDAIKGELKRRREGWGEDAAIRRVRAALFNKGEIARAWQMAARLAGDGAPAELEAVRREIRDRFAVDVRAVGRLLDGGRYAEAEKRFEHLETSVRGVKEFAGALEPLEKRLASDEAKQGAKAEKRILRLLRPFDKRHFRDVKADDIWKLRELATEHEGTPIGERLRRLDPFVAAVYCAVRGIHFSQREEKLAKARD